jgi:leucyl aminopeptidase
MKAATSGSDPLVQLVHLAFSQGDLNAHAPGLVQCYRPASALATHLLVCSVGEGGAQQLKKSVVQAVLALKSTKAKRLLVCLSGLAENQLAHLPVVVQAVAEASYVYTHTKPKAHGRKLTEVVLAVPNAANVQAAFDLAVATVKGVEFAKEWANRPGNHAKPSDLAGAARELAKSKRVKCDVLGLSDILKLGMGSFAAVAKGSSQKPQLIVLHYSGAKKSVAPTVLVGKGITFDSGGISLKPGPEMDEMKFDMCGAASVLGVFRALALLQPEINVVGVIPACENLPGPDALKPGDVITAMDGQTIEVLNTDAEGRLILCDALVYAKRFDPVAIVDIATLTGACVIALGAVRSGLFSNDDSLAHALWSAGEASQDLVWRMPLDEDYGQALKSNFATMANVAGRAAGAVTAAKFLQNFVKDTPWAHLDIAGTAWKSGAEKGATGRPVPLLLNYVLGQVARPVTAPVVTLASRRPRTRKPTA